MSRVIDVRNEEAQVKEIQWCDNIALSVVKTAHKKEINIGPVRVSNAGNLIKALQKAKELGWCK